MWPDRVSNPGPLTYESGALPIALRGPAVKYTDEFTCNIVGAGKINDIRRYMKCLSVVGIYTKQVLSDLYDTY